MKVHDLVALYPSRSDAENAGAHLVANGVADVQILNYFSDETVPVDTALYLSYRAKEDIQKVVSLLSGNQRDGRIIRINDGYWLNFCLPSPSAFTS
jgi:hypothetical protein